MNAKIVIKGNFRRCNYSESKNVSLKKYSYLCWNYSENKNVSLKECTYIEIAAKIKTFLVVIIPAVIKSFG